jgi:hypothetical protein
MAVLALCVALVALAATGPAAASPPAGFSLGFVADSLFPLYGAQSVPPVWYSRMRQIGSSWARIGAYWFAIAPQRPPAALAGDPAFSGYDWTYLDNAVRGAAAARQRILITIAYAPDWAEGPGAQQSRADHVWRPDAHALGQFARAVARRYSGRFADPAAPATFLPRVSDFQIWNEPNLADQLAPQWTGRGRHLRPASPALYRGLLTAAYAGIKAVQPHAYVLAAGLAPYGDFPGGTRMPPVQFLSEMLCLHSPSLRPEACPAPARADALDIHPYALTPTLPARQPLDVSVPDLGKVWRVLHAAQRAHRIVPRRGQGLWVTEIAWDSNPPDPNTPITTARQARYLSLAAYELWRQAVTHLFWTEVRDPGVQVGNLTGSGLFLPDGRAKPSTRAFRFPFVAIRGHRHVVTIWGRAPRPGRVVIERRSGHRWVPWFSLRARSGGIFFTQRRAIAAGPLRARSGGLASLPF